MIYLSVLVSSIVGMLLYVLTMFAKIFLNLIYFGLSTLKDPNENMRDRKR